MLRLSELIRAAEDGGNVAKSLPDLTLISLQSLVEIGAVPVAGAVKAVGVDQGHGGQGGMASHSQDPL